MILVSEVGDKTFLIAAILAMRHARFTVFAGAFGALALMSVLSAGMGHLLPALIPRRWTQIAAACLFIVFGLKMCAEAKGMESGSAEEIEDDEGPFLCERLRTKPRRGEGKPGSSFMEGLRNFCSFFLGPVFVQAFALTFLGEWGDRSQIATIALGAAHNVYLVTLGTVFGHACCTAVAVIGGRYVSTKISVKHVTFTGAILFLLFGIIYFYEAFATAADDTTIGGLIPDS
ncbi:hypothetical protein BD779DRAFT_1552575 [Infundibulicybe gibba]|nr:hypothetical protein BD779DRAFT_1552575 [Infundibulicybe gibba]